MRVLPAERGGERRAGVRRLEFQHAQGRLRGTRRFIAVSQGRIENMLHAGARLAVRCSDRGRIGRVGMRVAALQHREVLKLLLNFMDVQPLARMLLSINVAADMRMGERRHALQQCEGQDQKYAGNAPHSSGKVLSVVTLTGPGAIRFIYLQRLTLNRGFPDAFGSCVIVSANGCLNQRARVE